MHLNISSLQYHFDGLSISNIKFSTIGLSESWVKKDKPLLSNINLQDYKIEHTPTESEKNWSLLYYYTQLNYKVCNDLKIYKFKELEAIFIEMINT